MCLVHCNNPADWSNVEFSLDNGYVNFQVSFISGVIEWEYEETVSICISAVRLKRGHAGR